MSNCCSHKIGLKRQLQQLQVDPCGYLSSPATNGCKFEIDLTLPYFWACLRMVPAAQEKSQLTPIEERDPRVTKPKVIALKADWRG